MATRPPRGAGQTALPMGAHAAPGPPVGTALPGTAVRRPVGRVERAVCDSIRAARGEAPREVKLSALETLARQLAAGLDLAAAEPYALAQLGPRLLDVLTALQLTPQPRVDDDGLSDLIKDLKTVT